MESASLATMDSETESESSGESDSTVDVSTSDESATNATFLTASTGDDNLNFFESAFSLAHADLAGFKQQVAPLLSKYCTDCHGPDLAEADLALHNIDANLLSGKDFENWRLIEERVSFQEMPPQDSEQPTAVERLVLLRWIRGEFNKSMLPGAATHEKLLLPEFGNYVDHQALFGQRLPRVYPAPPRIWRLRPDIYQAAVGRVARRKAEGLSNALNLVDGTEFKDYAARYFLDEASTTQLVGNAKKIATAQLQGPFKDLVSEQGPPKAEKVLEAVELAFRLSLGRAPREEESQRFLAFYDHSKAMSDYKIAAKAMLSAVLLQPEFLFRQELGDGSVDEFGRVRLSQREIAFALSYALNSEPLDEFLAAAEAGKLGTSDQVAEAVRQRLEDDSIEYDKNPRLKQFFREYFGYPHATEVFKDQPEGGIHEPSMLVGDLELTIREILKADRQVLAELLTTRKYYVDTKWSFTNRGNEVTMRRRSNVEWPYHSVYGLPLDWRWSPHLQPVEFPRDERAGVLTHPAWLAAWSGNFDNHPVQRGKWIRTHLLGGTVPDVPIGVDARVPEAEHQSFRQRLEMTTHKRECWRCHQKMDPLGLPFERFDHYGRYQRIDAGQPVVVTGAITRTRVPGLDQTVSGPTEMMDRLAASQHVEQVFVRHVFRFFLGRNETLGDANTLQDAHKAYRENDGSFNALVVSLLSSDSFLYRQLIPHPQP